MVERHLAEMIESVDDLGDLFAIGERGLRRLKVLIEQADDTFAGQQELPMPPAQQVDVHELRMLVAHLLDIAEPRIVNMGEAQHMRDRIRANANELLTLLSPTDDTEG